MPDKSKIDWTLFAFMSAFGLSILVIIAISILVAMSPRIVLLKDEWSCIKTEDRQAAVWTGKTPAMTIETICIEYRRR